MTLVLEIEHLMGVAFAAIGPASDEPDWPPQPDRVFSALVAAWAARGCRPDEREALEWLERLDPPGIIASEYSPRTAPVSFVPPNDPETKTVGDRTVMPALRRRQPRRFPAARPDDPLVQLIWSGVDTPSPTLDRLDAIARDTASVGHSASLTRCRFTTSEMATAPQLPTRRIYEGRLAELETAFRAGRRPSPGSDVFARPASPARLEPTGSFSDRWVVLQYLPPDRRTDDVHDGAMPDLRAAALVAKQIRRALMSGYDKAGLAAAIPEWLSGHKPNGDMTMETHLAVVPMPFIGHEHADGRVLGFALVPPKGEHEDILADREFVRAFRKVADFDADQGRRILTVQSSRFKIRLSPNHKPDRASLRPQTYFDASQRFATVTPILLDRHLKEKGDARLEEIAAAIVRACANSGLPAPARVIVHKHSAFPVPSSRPSGRAPAWTGWQLPDAFASRQLTHAVLEFSDTVRGPVLLGAGRFVGLGLCHPIAEAAP